jgi:hypothetical protein
MWDCNLLGIADNKFSEQYNIPLALCHFDIFPFVYAQEHTCLASYTELNNFVDI